MKIVAELGYLPLAIEHAAAFIRQSLPDISKFLDVYSKSRKMFLERVPKQNYAYSRAVATTFLMSFNAVKTLNPVAAEPLILFAFLNPDGILIDFLQDGRFGLEEPLKTLIGDVFGFGMALADLDRNLCRRYQAQIDGPLCSLLELGTENVAKMCFRLSGFLWADGKYLACEELERIAVDIYANILGTEHRDILAGMNNLAETYRSLDQMKGAVELHEKVLEARQRTLGMEHPDTLTSMNNLALTYQNLGQMKEAANLHEKVLEARQRTFENRASEYIEEHEQPCRDISEPWSNERGCRAA